MGVWYSSGDITELGYTIQLPSMIHNAQIYIDSNGVAHIYAQDAHDLFLAEGYYEASQRLFELEFFGLLSMGNLSSWVGERALNSDIVMHLIGIPQKRYNERRTY